MHPDWQLLLDTLFVMTAQPRFPAHILACDPAQMLQLGNLIPKLQTNNLAQMTAAALFCRLHVCGIEHEPDPQKKFELFKTHLAAGVADGIMTALLFAVEVGLPARTTDLRLLAVSLRKLPV